MIYASRFRLAIFAYNFPHKKTQDFLLRMITEGVHPDIVLAANPVEIKIPAPSIRVKPRHYDLIHPYEICKRFGIPYFIVEHNSLECRDLLSDYSIDIGLISGARILDESIIKSVKKGIINIHPGLLPEGRGMDALQWAIYEDRPLGVTSHVINRRIDHGRILKRIVIPEYFDDTLLDLSLRLEQAQNTILVNSIYLLHERSIDTFEQVGNQFPLHRKMPQEFECLLYSLLKKRLIKINE